MGLFRFILGVASGLSKEEKSKKDRDLEKQMDYYGLNEHERELVKKGDYDPWNFEYPENEEKLDEDDFYSDDEGF